MFYRWLANALILNCRIQPGAKEDAFASTSENLLRIRIKAPPVDGKANAKLLEFLSRQFKTPKSAIEILSGHNSRNKRVRIASPNRLPPELNLSNHNNNA